MKRCGLFLASLLLVLNSVCAAADVDISGFWTLNVEQSDDPEEKLDDIADPRKQKRKAGNSKTEKKGPIGSNTYRRYWEHVAENKQWEAAADSAHGGSLRSVLFAKRLAIASTEKGYKVWYDDGFVRDITPNPYGRVFSASGDELIADGIGRTLSYYKGQKLLLETRTKPVGKVMETAQLSADGKQLIVQVEVDRPDWERIVVVRQTFDRTVTVDSSPKD